MAEAWKSPGNWIIQLDFLQSQLRHLSHHISKLFWIHEYLLTWLGSTQKTQNRLRPKGWTLPSPSKPSRAGEQSCRSTGGSAWNAFNTPALDSPGPAASVSSVPAPPAAQGIPPGYKNDPQTGISKDKLPIPWLKSSLSAPSSSITAEFLPKATAQEQHRRFLLLLGSWC